MEVNEYLFAHKDDGNNGSTPLSSGNTNDNNASKEDTNEGTLTLDATCAPANIRYPQNIPLLNEASEKLETIIYRFVNLLVCQCQDVTGGVPEKTT